MIVVDVRPSRATTIGSGWQIISLMARTFSSPSSRAVPSRLSLQQPSAKARSCCADFGVYGLLMATVLNWREPYLRAV